MAVAAVLIRRQAVEPTGRGHPPAFLTSIDVANRLRRLAGEAGAGIERAVRADGVGVTAVELAGPHVHAVGRVEPALPRFGAKEGHRLIGETAGVARAADRCSRSRARHAR